MPNPKFKYLVPHSPAWRVLRREESQRRRKIRDYDGGERLAPGPLPDPDLDRSQNNLSTLLTDREYTAFMKSKPKGMTKSLWLRGMVCEFLERRRVKAAPTMPFTIISAVTESADAAAREARAARR
jgi:hypothetical protein